MMFASLKEKMIPYIIALSFFMEAIDSTILNTAIPSMAQSLAVNPIDLKMALISYLLSLSIFIPISGWLADKFGSKQVFIFALSVFTLSSLWCGFAQNLPQIVIARFIQGLGGALGIPVGRLIIIRTFGHQQLMSKMSQVITIGALGVMLGPYIGGYITTHFSWHWIFLVNIPIGIFAIILSRYALNSDKTFPPPPLDKTGFLLFSTSLCGFIFSLSAFSESNISPQHALIILCLSCLLFMGYNLHSRRQLNPIVKTDLFYFRTFRIAALGNIISRIGFGGVPFIVPLFLQTELGFSPELSGALLIPVAIGLILAKPCAIIFVRHMGFKYVLLFNTLLSGISIMLFALIHHHTSLYFIATLTFVYGFVTAIQYSGMNTLAYSDIPHESLSAATSITGTIQQLSQSIGVAVSAIFLIYFEPSSHSFTTSMFHHTFLSLGTLTILSTLIFIHLTKEDGHQMIS